MTPYDRRLLADAALGSGARAALAWVVMSLVDEPSMSRADRASRVAALGPLLGALSTWLVAARASNRGETMALALAGVGRARALAGALVGGLPLGLLSGAVLASGRLPLATLLPRAPSSGLTPTSDGFAHAVALVGSGGVVWRDALGASSVSPGGTPAALGASLVVLAPALGWLAVRPWRPALGGACGASITVAALVGFHAAARPGGAAWLALAPAAALGWVVASVRPATAAR